jgi:hypothetical protein
MIALALVAASAGGVALVSQREAVPKERPRLALLTSLPLLFGEHFALDAPKNAAVARIERAFAIVPIATADAASLKRHSLLLMAHPRAQPAEVLVELDAWVRRGGQVVLLADPLLKWESNRTLGDRLRPPPDFADTGLLGHWGLQLAIDETGEGVLRATGARCALRERGLVARCRVGRGSASVIADADFLMAGGADARARLDLMMAELSRAESR